jgi:hypothetical protein
MTGYDHQMSRQPGLPLIFCLLIALLAGLLVGLLLILLGYLAWPGSLFLLLSPLPALLGMIGRLVVGPRKKRPLLIWSGIGGLSWFVSWLSVLMWMSFQPQTIQDCSFPDGPCLQTTVSFWGDYAGELLFVFFFFLGVGLVYVLVGVVFTSIVLDSMRQRANKPK